MKLRGLHLVLCDNLEGWGGGYGREVQEGGITCVLIVDSLPSRAKTNTMF